MTKNENQLIKQIKNGDPTAWDNFQKECTPIILRVIERHRLGHKISDHLKVAEKVLSEVYGYIQRTEIRKGFECLLYKPTLFKIYRFSKANKTSFAEVTDDIPDMNSTPLEAIVEGEEAEELKTKKKYLVSCMKKLTKVQRQVIRLLKGGKSEADIARIREVSRSAINQTKDAAFKALRDCINEMQRIREPDFAIHNC